jgi:imidazolonepropionase-like amidohydrolase
MHKQSRLITADRLFDAVDGSIKTHAGLLMSGEVIADVGDLDTLRWDPTTVERRDFGDATILPGLIDSHVHFNMVGDGSEIDDVLLLSDDTLLIRSVIGARKHLEAGVTTARECGAKGRTIFSLLDAAASGLIEIPRTLACGRPVTITGGHMWAMGQEADGVVEVRRAVRQLAKEGAQWVKVPATGGTTGTSMTFRQSFTDEELCALVDEAHKLGRVVGAHCVANAGIEAALDADVDMIIHAYLKDQDGKWRYDDALIEKIASSGRPVNTTLHIRRARVEAINDGRIPPDCAGTMDEEIGEMEARIEAARRLRAAGVVLVPGSDAGAGWFALGEFWRELECLTEVGLSANQALMSATRDASRLLQIDQETGTLQRGKDADVLVVAGNPCEDLSDLKRVTAVYAKGREIRNETLRLQETAPVLRDAY